MVDASQDDVDASLMVGNDELELLLDAVDSRTAQQSLLHDSMADGFMALARERYRDPSSLQRKSGVFCSAVPVVRLYLSY